MRKSFDVGTFRLLTKNRFPIGATVSLDQRGEYVVRSSRGQTLEHGYAKTIIDRQPTCENPHLAMVEVEWYPNSRPPIPESERPQRIYDPRRYAIESFEDRTRRAWEAKAAQGCAEGVASFTARHDEQMRRENLMNPSYRASKLSDAISYGEAHPFTLVVSLPSASPRERARPLPPDLQPLGREIEQLLADQSWLPWTIEQSANARSNRDSFILLAGEAMGESPRQLGRWSAGEFQYAPNVHAIEICGGSVVTPNGNRQCELRLAIEGDQLYACPAQSKSWGELAPGERIWSSLGTAPAALLDLLPRDHALRLQVSASGRVS
jgi:hypothetical protein